MAGDVRRLGCALLLCAAATGAELLGGLVTRSLALTADGLHSLVHVGALAVALWGARASARARAAAPTINAVVIIVLSAGLAVESLERLAAPQTVAYGPAVALTLFGLLSTLVTLAALGRGRAADLNHQAARLHMMGDVAVALLALTGLGAGAVFGWRWADAAAGLAGAALLCGLGGRLVLRTLAVSARVAPLRL